MRKRIRRVLGAAAWAVSLALISTSVAMAYGTSRWGVPLGAPPVDVAFVDLDGDGFTESLLLLTRVATEETRRLASVSFPSDAGSIQLFRVEPDGSAWRVGETVLYREVLLAVSGACGYRVCFQVEGLAANEPVQLLNWGHRVGDLNRALVLSERFGGIFDVGALRVTPAPEGFALYGGPSLSSVLLLNYCRFLASRQVKELLFVEGDPWMATADLDGDGNTDLLIAISDIRSLRGFLGDGGFTPVVTPPPPPTRTPSACGASMGDPAKPFWSLDVGGRGDEPRYVGTANLDQYRGYAKLGIVVAKGGILSSEVQIIAATKDGRFIPGDLISVTGQPRSAIWGDFNRDGRVDLVVAGVSSIVFLPGAAPSAEGVPRFSGKVSVGDVSFPADLLGGVRMVALDFDRDHLLDFVVANYGAGSVDVWRGGGDGTFTRVQRLRFGDGAKPISIAVADVSMDGWPDLVVVSQGTNEVSVALNDGVGGLRVVDMARPSGRLFAVGPVSGGDRDDIISTAYAVVESVDESRTSTATIEGVAIPMVDWVNVMYARVLKKAPTTLSSPRLVTYGALSPSALQAAISQGLFTEERARQLNMVVGTTSTATTATISPFVDILSWMSNGQDASEYVLAGKASSPVPVPFAMTTSKRSAGSDDPRPYPVRLALGDLDGDGVPEVVTLAHGRTPGALHSVVVHKVFRVGPSAAAATPWTWYETASLVGLPYEIVKYTGPAVPVDVVVGQFMPPAAGGQIALLKRDPMVEVIRVTADTDVTAARFAEGFLKAEVVGWAPTGDLPTCAVAVDLNGDGRDDLVVGTDGVSGEPLSVLLRNSVPGGSPRDQLFDLAVVRTTRLDGVAALLAHDLTGDGQEDVIAAGRRSANVVTLRASAGTLQVIAEVRPGAAPTSIAVADFNGDGRPDLAVLNVAGKVEVFLGNGDGSFGPAPVTVVDKTEICPPILVEPWGVVERWPYWVGTGDVNGDGRPDLLVAYGRTGDLPHKDDLWVAVDMEDRLNR